jgi:imidazolonepropionase-like amidohydrolase
VAHGNDTFQNETAYRLLVQKKQPLFITITDIVGQMQTGDIQRTGGRNSRAMMAEKTFKKLLAAGVPLPFSSGASGDGDNGIQANEFPYMVKWGMTPVQALQSAFMMAASLLNYNWADRVGSIEKGKFADVIAVSGNPLTDISEMQRVKFVMKGGVTVRNDLSEAARTASAAW